MLVAYHGRSGEPHWNRPPPRTSRRPALARRAGLGTGPCSWCRRCAPRLRSRGANHRRSLSLPKTAFAT
eukprot:14101765-Alexandrium_andersonii.AAC.1